jgi:hypothetical protein
MEFEVSLKLLRVLIPQAIPRSAKPEIRLAAPIRLRSRDLGAFAPNWRSNARSVTCSRRPQAYFWEFSPDSFPGHRAAHEWTLES